MQGELAVLVNKVVFERLHNIEEKKFGLSKDRRKIGLKNFKLF